MKLIEAIESRRSIRKFKEKQVKWPDILEAIDSASKAPLAGNINTIKFVIITDDKMKQKIAEHADQLWIAQSDTVVVVCSDNAQLERMYHERSVIYAPQQIGASIQNFILRLTDLGLSSCWVGAFYEDGIKKALKIPANIRVEAIIPVGYSNENPKPQKKEALEHLISWEIYGQKKKPTLFRESTKR